MYCLTMWHNERANRNNKLDFGIFTTNYCRAHIKLQIIGLTVQIKWNYNKKPYFQKDLVDFICFTGFEMNM